MKQIIIAFVITCLFGCYGTPPQKTGKEGEPLPSFSLLLTDSSTWFNTNSIPKGQAFGVFIFSPYCPYCRAQTQDMIDHIQDLKTIRFYFVSSFPLPLLKDYYKEFQMSRYPNITIGRDTGNAIGNYLGTKGIPFLAIYGKDKKLNECFMGRISIGQIQSVAND